MQRSIAPERLLKIRKKYGRLRLFSKGWGGIIFLDEKGRVLKVYYDQTLHRGVREYTILKILEKYGIAPRVYWYDRELGVLCREYIQGAPLGKVIDAVSSSHKLLLRLLRVCFILDMLGIEQGEMSYIKDNIIMFKGNFYVVDFDKGKIKHRGRNLQKLISRRFYKINREVARLAKEYKELINRL